MARFAWTAILLLWIGPGYAWAQDSAPVCANGEGRFSATFETGVTVTVEATQQHGLAERSCEAVIASGESRLVIAKGAAEVDVDVMGADLGLGEPVVAIQFRKSELDKRTTYEIYSLKKTPQLMRTLTGSTFFRAADYKLDGKIDIRAADAAAVDGFEGIPLSSFDFVPAVFLRFENHKLVDVSAEYRPDFDQRIAELKAGLDRETLAEFKQSDGMLASGFRMPEVTFRALLLTKIRVLEIVWGYLYSGRDDEAWRALDEMWPAADVDRVRLAILDARKHGIRAEVDEVSTSGPRKVKPLLVLEAEREQPGNASSVALPGHSDNLAEGGMPFGETRQTVADRMKYVDSNPTPIYMREECAAGDCALQGNEEVLVDLVVDDAGKVRSAKPANTSVRGTTIDGLLKNALNWRFIPAFKMGRPVACKMELTVNLNQ